MYVITGATGNYRQVLTEALLAKGQKVRVIGRSTFSSLPRRWNKPWFKWDFPWAPRNS